MPQSDDARQAGWALTDEGGGPDFGDIWRKLSLVVLKPPKNPLNTPLRPRAAQSPGDCRAVRLSCTPSTGYRCLTKAADGRLPRAAALIGDE